MATLSVPNKIKRLAIETARQSQYRFRLGAVVFRGRQALSRGYNKAHKTHPKSPHPYYSIHAELDAVIGLHRSDLKGASIYVHRLLKDDTTAMAKPCQYCMGMLKNIGIREIYWSEDEKRCAVAL